MVTFTGVPSSREEAGQAWSHLVQEIRRRNGGTAWEYARFFEAGADTGALHWHVAQRGAYIPQTWLSRHSEAVGLGPVVWITGCHGAGAAWYVSKYITKEAAPAGWRKVSTSAGGPRLPEHVSLATGWELVKGGILPVVGYPPIEVPAVVPDLRMFPWVSSIQP